MIDIADSIIESIADLEHAPSIMCIEDYGPINRTSGKIAQRAELCGILKHHFLRVYKVPVITVTPTSLKLFATGKGNASKEEMLNACARLGYHPDTNDEADAYFCAMLGEYVLLGNRHGADIRRTNP